MKQFDSECGSQNPVQQAVGATQALPSAVLSAITSVGLVDDDGAAAFFGCSKRHLQTFMDADWMPKPIHIGARMRRWSVDELRAAIARMPRQAQQEQPASLLRARIERAKTTGALAAPESPAPASSPARRYRSGVPA